MQRTLACPLRDNQENVLPNYSTKPVVVAAAVAAHLRPHNECNITHPQHYSSSEPHLHYLQTHKKNNWHQQWRNEQTPRATHPTPG